MSLSIGTSWSNIKVWPQYSALQIIIPTQIWIFYQENLVPWQLGLITTTISTKKNCIEVFWYTHAAREEFSEGSLVHRLPQFHTKHKVIAKKLWATVTKAEINSWHTRSLLPWVTSWDFRMQLWTPRRARGRTRLRFPTHKSHYSVVCLKQEAAGPTAARQVNSGRLEQAPLRTDTSNAADKTTHLRAGRLGQYVPLEAKNAASPKIKDVMRMTTLLYCNCNYTWSGALNLDIICDLILCNFPHIAYCFNKNHKNIQALIVYHHH